MQIHALAWYLFKVLTQERRFALRFSTLKKHEGCTNFKFGYVSCNVHATFEACRSWYFLPNASATWKLPNYCSLEAIKKKTLKGHIEGLLRVAYLDALQSLLKASKLREYWSGIFKGYLAAFCCTLFQLLLIGSKWAALVCTFFDYHRGDTEMQLRWPEPG